MVDHSTDDGALDRAGASDSPTRDRVHAVVREAVRPLTVAEIAEAVGVHRTAARRHLQRLTEVGRVHELTLPPVGRGRPRLAYRAVDEQPYRTMATWLAEAIDPQTAISIGRSVGVSLTTSRGTAVEQIVDEATRRGFDPQVERGAGGRLDVVLRACPFADVARHSPAVVCGLHRGIMEGIAATAGGVAVERLEVVDPTRGDCRLVLRSVGHE